MPLHPSACPLDCPDACGALLETDAEGRFVRLRGNPAHSWSQGTLCSKTAAYHEVVHGPQRLLEPLVRRDGVLCPATWDEALDLVARRVGGLDGDRILGLSYAGNMGQVARNFPSRLFHALGAWETDGAICDATPEAAHAAVLGAAVGPDLEVEVERSDLIVVWGAELRRTVQHLYPRVLRALRAGAAVFVVDVWRSDTLESLAAHGAIPVVLRPGTDAALALALVGWAFAAGRVDEARLDDETLGWRELRAATVGAWTPARLQEVTGLEPATVDALEQALFAARRPLVKTGVGFARRRNGGASMRAVCALAAVLGHADRLHFESGDHFGLDNSSVARAHQRPAGTEGRVLSHAALGLELERHRFGAVFIHGHNPAAVCPDSARVRRALADPGCFVVVHELAHTETTALADLVLPATALPEQTDLYRSYGHRVLQLSRRVCEAPGSCRSNVDAFRALGVALGAGAAMGTETEEELVEGILEASRERFQGDELERVKAGEPVKLAPRPALGRGTASGRIELLGGADASEGLRGVPAWRPDDGGGTEGAFRLVCLPSVATHNTTYSASPRHRGRAGAPCVYGAPEDLQRLGIQDGQAVRVHNHQASLTLQARLDPRTPAGLLRIEGFPLEADIPEGLGVNALVPPAHADAGAGAVTGSAFVDLAPVR